PRVLRAHGCQPGLAGACGARAAPGRLRAPHGRARGLVLVGLDLGFVLLDQALRWLRVLPVGVQLRLDPEAAVWASREVSHQRPALSDTPAGSELGAHGLTSRRRQ